jgi:hypothetical protein
MTLESMAVDLMTEPSGARFPTGKTRVREDEGAREPALPGALRIHDHVVWFHAILLLQQGAEAKAAFRCLPCVQICREGFTGDGQNAGFEKAECAKVEHDFGNAAREKCPDGGMKLRAVGQDIHESRCAPVDRDPIGYGGPRDPGGMSDGRDMKQQICGSTERGVDCHGVPNRRRRQDIPHLDPALFQGDHGARRTHGEIPPDGLAGRRQRGMRERDPERFRHDLGRGRRAEKLASAASRTAGAAAKGRGFLQ